MKKVSYILGLNVGGSFVESGVEGLDFEEFLDGVKTVLEHKAPKIAQEEAEKIINEYASNLNKKREEKEQEEINNNKKAGQAYLDENKTKEGVEVTKTGLQYKVITKGDGKQPSAHGRVKCHYEGRLIDGHIFDSSYKRGEPAVFGLDQVIPGWTEGLQLMNVGSKYELTLPADLAYGDRGVNGAIPPCSVLIFTVELLEVL